MMLCAILLSALACVPKPEIEVVTPLSISVTPAGEIEGREVDCLPLIDAQEAAFLSGTGADTENACMDLEACYLQNWNLWKGRYMILEAEVREYQSR